MEKLYSLTDKQFALIEPILQEEKDARGRKPKIMDRHALEGALYILREGCRWRAMPEAFGHWMMVFMRYKRRVERGVWWSALMRLQKAGVLKGSVIFMDSSRAYRHAAGARKKGAARLQAAAKAVSARRFACLWIIRAGCSSWRSRRGSQMIVSRPLNLPRMR